MSVANEEEGLLLRDSEEEAEPVVSRWTRWARPLFVALAIAACIASIAGRRAAPGFGVAERKLFTSEELYQPCDTAKQERLALQKEAPAVERFVFNHLSKTGGTLASNILLALNLEFEQGYARVATDLKTGDAKKRSEQGEFVFVKDTTPLSAFTSHTTDFVVGSQRNVCDLYKSEWRYEPQKACSWSGNSSECLSAIREKSFDKWLAKSSFHGIGYKSYDWWSQYRQG